MELASFLRSYLPHNSGELESFLSKKRELSLELQHLRLIENQCWKQKSRVRWLKERDQNTSFFHEVASGHRRTNLITPGMIPLPDDANAGILIAVVTDIFKE